MSGPRFATSIILFNQHRSPVSIQPSVKIAERVANELQTATRGCDRGLRIKGTFPPRHRKLEELREVGYLFVGCSERSIVVDGTNAS